MRTRRARRDRGAAAAALGVAIFVALASPHGARAQQAAPRSAATLTLGGGIALPSGGDLNDTYAPGPHISSTVSVGVARRLALRLGATFSSFAPSPAPKHTERDPRTGYAADLSLGAVGTLASARDRAILYVLVSGGRERVGSTWLNANNVVEPYSHTDLWNWGFGAGSEVTSRIGIEVQRMTAHRGSRGVVGYIPVGIRVRL